MKNLRFGALYILLFFSNAQFEEVASLKISDVSVLEEGNLRLIFRKAKNNHFRTAKMAMVASL